MNDKDKDILLQAMRLDPNRVIELLRVNWSELEIDFKLIFKR